MGYRFSPRTAKLVFEDFEGAEVRVTLDHPLGMLIEAQKLQVKQDIEGLCRFVTSILVDWNVEDEKGPIPTTYKGMMRVYPSFVNALVTAWMEAQINPSAPLPETSSAGDN